MEGNQNPYVTPSSKVEPEAAAVELPFLKSWLMFFLVSSIGGAILGAAAGAVIGGAMGSAGIPLDTIKWTTGSVGALIGIPLSYFTFKWSVRKYLISASLLATAPARSQA